MFHVPVEYNYFLNRSIRHIDGTVPSASLPCSGRHRSNRNKEEPTAPQFSRTWPSPSLTIYYCTEETYLEGEGLFHARYTVKVFETSFTGYLIDVLIYLKFSLWLMDFQIMEDILMTFFRELEIYSQDRFKKN